MEKVPSSWRPLKFADFPPTVKLQYTVEHPDVRLFEGFLIRAYEAQGGGALEAPEDIEDFRRWLAYQQMESETAFPFRKWPRLEAMLYATFSDKAQIVAQRSCRTCQGADLEGLHGSAFMAIRITPISRQVKKHNIFKAYQAAIASRLAERNLSTATGRFCLALTFVLNSGRPDRDLDNMTKALQDAVARAAGFNDRHVHHLDVIKLIFPDTEEFVYLRIAASALNQHGEVLVKKTAHSWAGWPLLCVEDFLPLSGDHA